MKIKITSKFPIIINMALGANRIIGDEIEQKEPAMWESEDFINKDEAFDVAEELKLNFEAEPYNLTIGEGLDFEISLILTRD